MAAEIRPRSEKQIATELRRTRRQLSFNVLPESTLAQGVSESDRAESLMRQQNTIDNIRQSSRNLGRNLSIKSQKERSSTARQFAESAMPMRALPTYTQLQIARRIVSAKQKKAALESHTQIDKTADRMARRFWLGYKSLSYDPFDFIIASIVTWTQFFRTILPLDKMAGSGGGIGAFKKIAPPAFKLYGDDPEESALVMSDWLYHGINAFLWAILVGLVLGILALLYFWVAFWSDPLNTIYTFMSEFFG